MHPARLPVSATKAGSPLNLLYARGDQSGRAYLLSPLKCASSRVAYMLSISFRTSGMVLLALQDLRSGPVDRVVVHPGILGLVSCPSSSNVKSEKGSGQTCTGAVLPKSVIITVPMCDNKKHVLLMNIPSPDKASRGLLNNNPFLVLKHSV